ncbi:MAG: flotillin family protein [Gemmatimonadaceae bacterium]
MEELSGLIPILGIPLIIFAVFIGIIGVIKACLIIVPPNMVAIITGPNRATESGGNIGYRVVRGGRAFRIPLLETVAYMDLRTFSIPLNVSNTFARGGIPINVQAQANVKIASMPESVFGNAVERFLGVHPEEIAKQAQETLTGNLRGVLASLSPEEANEDRTKFEQSLAEEATRDLNKLGLQLDTLKIQQIADEAGYLAAFGRMRTAEVLRNAEIAEANARAETKLVQAEAEKRAKVAESQNSTQVAEAQNLLRVRKAELEQQSQIAERTATAKAEEAQAAAMRQVEAQRIELTKLELQVREVEPARARLQAAQLAAEAAAAPIREDGKAKAEAAAMILEKIRNAGDQGMQLLVLQMYPELFQIASDAVGKIEIDRMVVMDGGSGDGGLSQAAGQRLKAIQTMLEGVGGANGFDPSAVLQGILGKLSAPEREVAAAPVPAPALPGKGK